MWHNQVYLKTAGEINVKCDAKFYIKLAARGKANVGLYSDIWSLIRNPARKADYYCLRVVKKANYTLTAGRCQLKNAYAAA